MPIDLLQERHRTGSQQLLTWIHAALKIFEVVAESQQDPQRDEEEDEELEMEIQDVVSGFGQYEPTIESSIEILLQLEESIAERSSSTTLDYEDDQPLSPELETIAKQWSRLRRIIDDLNGSIREHHRLRDGIQSVRNMWEQTRQATGILEKCLTDTAADRQRSNEFALSEAASRNGSSCSVNSQHSASSRHDGSTSMGVDRNDVMELDSRIELLSIQIDTLQKSYPECTRSSKELKSKARSSKQQESGSIAEKKYLLSKLYRELARDWHSLRLRKDQLWRDLQECGRWRTRIEKMATQIETMLEPVEIFHKMCSNLLATLEGQESTQQSSTNASLQSLAIRTLDITQNTPCLDTSDAEMGMLMSTLQELDEKQTVLGPAVENMFWVQEGEMQHRSKPSALPPTTPTTANTDLSLPSPSISDYSPLYPNLAMLERQRRQKNRWSKLKTSLDTVGAKLQEHHRTLQEKANQAKIKKEVAEDETLVDGNGWSSRVPASPMLRRSATAGPQKSPTSTASWNASTRLLRGRLVHSMSMDSSTVRKYMCIKSDKPVWTKPRPWCPPGSVSSAGLPGFPLQTSQWGYFFVGASQSVESFGTMVAAPAPSQLRSPTPAPAKPKPPALKIDRPPFSPGGNRRHTALNKPPPTPTRALPSRSMSVAGGDFKNRPTPSTAYDGNVDWSKTLRSPSSAAVIKQSPGGKGGRSNFNTPATPANNKIKRAASAKGMAMTPMDRRTSSASMPGPAGAWNSGRNGMGNRGNNALSSINSSRRQSVSSSEDGTVMGHPSTHHNAHRDTNFQKNGGFRPMSNPTDSSSSLDSMTSSSNDSYVGRNTYGSSMSSSVGARSPSPYAPMFGSSFAAARSSAALHSVLLASNSSASLRYSSSSLSGNESRQQQQNQKDTNHQQQILTLGSTSASSWMSMNMNVNTGSILSALSFTVPTYNVEEDFGPLGQIDDSIAAM
ncbi:hypothetical protein EDD21DRAFT_391331 [Dissophora ornata]|nr:hypothetical protein EDD21DRAFT_391331 [Dissophora ornata]